MPRKDRSERRGTRRGGFTLIELLIVIVVIGILAAIVVARYNGVKEKAFVATLKSDLRNLSSSEELYYATAQSYTDDLTLLNFDPSEGVNVSVNEIVPSGWAATATHDALTGRQCGIFYGNGSAANGSPATIAGSVACN